ncbi:MAG: hypothetical protein MUC34_02205 [Anaerolineae bacterium]|nr:hypothetical protein [Anaerolineae bacterium]
MKHRSVVLVCLVALVLSVIPASVTHAAAPESARRAVALVSGEQLLAAGSLPAQTGGPSAPLQALRVGFTESELFTVVCREWAAGGDIESTQGSWYLGEKPSLGETVGSLPIVGHACAFTEDPSLENGVILALDIPVVILYAKVVYDGVVAVNSIAMTVTALAPVALTAGPSGVVNAIQMVRTQAEGYLAVIKQDLATARREQARTAQLQAHIKENHDWTVALNEEWITGALPKIAQAALADPTVRRAVGDAIETAGDAAGTAVESGAAAVGRSAATAGLAAGAGAENALAAAAAAAGDVGAWLRAACVNLPEPLRAVCPATETAQR